MAPAVLQPRTSGRSSPPTKTPRLSRPAARSVWGWGILAASAARSKGRWVGFIGPVALCYLAAMNKVRVLVSRIEESRGEPLPLPVYETTGSAGLDLRADVSSPVAIPPMGRAVVPTGISIALPDGHEAQVRSRSGLAAKHGVTCLNSPGTIDSDYRGEIGVILANLSDAPFIIERGDRIAQMIVAPVSRAELIEVGSLEETARGEGGFGHTGVS